jgi:hypothetical protein
MRDEEMALRDEEVTGELPADLEYEEFNEIREQLAALIEAQLAVYKTRKSAGSRPGGARVSGAVSARAHFDVARIVVDQAVRLGVAQADFTGLPPNGSRLMITEPRYRRMSLTNIEQVMPVKLAQALANPLFPALDSACARPSYRPRRAG